MTKDINPIRATDADAINLAKDLIANARFGAISFLKPDTHTPSVSRIALAARPGETPFSLVSELSNHSRALLTSPACALLLGEPGPHGDPLSHPRISLHCQANFVHRSDPVFADFRTQYLGYHAESKLYIDFSDFLFVRFRVTSADLNGGFGKAYRLTAENLDLTHNMG